MTMDDGRWMMLWYRPSSIVHRRYVVHLMEDRYMTRQVLLICADHRRAARIQVALLRYGCMVEVASTFRRGLAVIQYRPPTAIVLDQALPGLDHDQLARV